MATKLVLALAVLYAVDAMPVAMNPDQVATAIGVVTDAKVLLDTRAHLYISLFNMFQAELREMVTLEKDEEIKMSNTKTAIQDLTRADPAYEHPPSLNAIAGDIVNQVHTAKAEEMHQQNNAVETMMKALSHNF